MSPPSPTWAPLLPSMPPSGNCCPLPAATPAASPSCCPSCGLSHTWGGTRQSHSAWGPPQGPDPPPPPPPYHTERLSSRGDQGSLRKATCNLEEPRLRSPGRKRQRGNFFPTAIPWLLIALSPHQLPNPIPPLLPSVPHCACSHWLGVGRQDQSSPLSSPQHSLPPAGPLLASPRLIPHRSFHSSVWWLQRRGEEEERGLLSHPPHGIKGVLGGCAWAMEGTEQSPWGEEGSAHP